MPRRVLVIDRPLEQVWRHLQLLETWEGIGGMNELRDPHHRSDGTLAHFQFSIDTPLGSVDEDAIAVPEVDERSRTMHVRTEAKGLSVTIDLRLTPTADDPTATTADFAIDAEATNFFARPLASTLRHTLESGIDREGDRMIQRLET